MLSEAAQALKVFLKIIWNSQTQELKTCWIKPSWLIAWSHIRNSPAASPDCDTGLGHENLPKHTHDSVQHTLFDPPEVLTTLSTLMIQFIRKGWHKVLQVSQFQRPPNVFIRVLVKRIKIHSQRARKQYWILFMERGDWQWTQNMARAPQIFLR